MLELKFDAMGSTTDQRIGHINVRGYVKNLGTEPLTFSAMGIEFSLTDPDGKSVFVRSDAPRNNRDVLRINPLSRYDFEAELEADAESLYVGRIYRLTGKLPEGGDQDTSMFTFRQFYLGAAKG